MDNKLYLELIPPPTYQHRNGFTNGHRIDNLTAEQKIAFEKRLIEDLSAEKNGMDDLIVSSLVHLKSVTALPVLRQKLAQQKGSSKLILAISIYELAPEDALVSAALDGFQQEVDKKQWSAFIGCFYYLAKFNRPDVDEVIKSFYDHKDMLVRYNAQRSIALRDNTEMPTATPDKPAANPIPKPPVVKNMSFGEKIRKWLDDKMS